MNASKNHGKRKKKRKKRSKSKTKSDMVTDKPSTHMPAAEIEGIDPYRAADNWNPNANTVWEDTTNSVRGGQETHEDDGRCKDCLMEHCTMNKPHNSAIDFSFVFKDDKPVTHENHEDQEVITNPQEPMRIEEKVR